MSHRNVRAWSSRSDAAGVEQIERAVGSSSAGALIPPPRTECYGPEVQKPGTARRTGSLTSVPHRREPRRRRPPSGALGEAAGDPADIGIAFVTQHRDLFGEIEPDTLE